MRAYWTAIIMASVGVFSPAQAQWNLATNLPLQYKYMTVALECYSGIVERCGPVGVTEPNPPGAFRSMATLNAYKSKVKELIPYYVDHSKTNAVGGSYSYTNGTTEFPHWTVTGAMAHAGIATNYLDRPAWAYRWWHTNNWDGLARAISVMRWTEYAGGAVIDDKRSIAHRGLDFSGSPTCNTALTNNLIEYENAPIATNSVFALHMYGVSGAYKRSPCIDPSPIGFEFFSDRNAATVKTVAGGIYTGLSHSAHLYGYATNEVFTANPLWNKVYNDVDSLGYTKGQWAHVGDATGGVMVAANRYTDYIGVEPTLASNKNPVAMIPVNCSSPCLEVQGMTLRLNGDDWLLKWDADTNGMRYLINGI